MRSLPFGLLDRLIAAPSPGRVEFLRHSRFAHRGLHGDGRVENSWAAFSAALDAGQGIECDVQCSADGVAFVFHDADLDRLTDEHGPVRERMAAALDGIALRGSDEMIPRLSDMLARIAASVYPAAPLLIEIKTPDRHIVPVCRSVRRALEGYGGDAAIMSFNPLVCSWFNAHAPHVVRGLVVTHQGKRPLGAVWGHRVAMWQGRPDFLAYDVRDLPSSVAQAARSRGLPVLTWTVRSAEQVAVAAAHADQPIHEYAPWGGRG